MRRIGHRLLAGLLLLTVIGGLGCKGTSPEIAAAAKPFTLTVWGMFDDSDAYQAIIADYRAAHPYVQVQYQKLRPEEYTDTLINTLAEDRGPDIFLVHNTKVREYESKIAPMPKSISIAELVLKGTVKKEAAYELHQKNLLTLRQLQAQFPDQVVRDAVRTVEEPQEKGGTIATQKIFGLPLSIDSLALFWNRELLNAAGIAQPPVTWTEVQQQVKKLTQADAVGNIIQSGAALGTAKNISRGTDMLSLLMMQNGTQMAGDDEYPTFNLVPPELQGRPMPPGAEALVFYTDFANPKKEVYTWNDTLPDSLDAFVTGQTAMMLGYSYQIPLIQARAPKLKFGIAPAPQIPGNPEKNFANYWLYTVSKKSKHQEIAWDFLQFMTSEKEAQKFLDVTGLPTALRSLIPNQTENLELGVFAHQILTAESWYHGADADAMEEIFRDMIAQALLGEKPIEIINRGVDRVAQTIRQRE